MIGFEVFENPPRYWLYGLDPDGKALRIGGYESISEAKAKVDTLRGNQGWTFSLWESTGWKEVKLK